MNKELTDKLEKLINPMDLKVVNYSKHGVRGLIWHILKLIKKESELNGNKSRDVKY